MDKRDSSLFGYDLFEEYYMNENKFYYFERRVFTPFKKYYLADLKTLNVRELREDEIVIIENKEIEVQELAYKSPFWLVVFR